MIEHIFNKRLLYIITVISLCLKVLQHWNQPFSRFNSRRGEITLYRSIMRQFYHCFWIFILRRIEYYYSKNIRLKKANTNKSVMGLELCTLSLFTTLISFLSSIVQFNTAIYVFYQILLSTGLHFAYIIVLPKIRSFVVQDV